jgi:hypothetical protein
MPGQAPHVRCQLPHPDLAPVPGCFPVQAPKVLAHPVIQRRVTALHDLLSWPLPAGAAVHLHNLTEVTIRYMGVFDVRATKGLSCLTRLTAGELYAALDEPVLQPSDLPPRLHLFRMWSVPLCNLHAWLPALSTVSMLCHAHERAVTGSVMSLDGLAVYKRAGQRRHCLLHAPCSRFCLFHMHLHGSAETQVDHVLHLLVDSRVGDWLCQHSGPVSTTGGISKS